MEEEIIKNLEQIFTKNSSTSILSSIISLISNFSTSESTIASVHETLARFLQIHGKSYPNSVPHVLNLLSYLSIVHPRLAPSIFDLVRNRVLEFGSGRVGAHVLSALVTIADQDGSLNLEIDSIGEGLFLSLCFRPTVYSRIWLLLNAERFSVRPSILITVFLGFTKDSYPYVRKSAVDGLVRLCRNVDIDDVSLLGGCYLRGLQLLKDDEDCIRKTAVCAVSEFGMKIVSMHTGQNKRDWSDLVFLEICSSVRDMDVGVRIEVFDSLGRIEMVSENILLQTLSKKVLGIIDIKRHVRNYFPRDLEKQIPSLVGGFLHGLEDEFSEVRGSACRSMKAFVVLSDRFSGSALNLLVDVLSDYSVDVRLQALSAIHAMAEHKYLKLNEEHMHMFISTLIDKETMIRSEARKILQCMETSLFEIFKSCVDGLIQCLETYPKEDAHILYTLFKFGQNHWNFSLQITQEFFPQGLSPSKGGRSESGPEDGRMPAILILAISGTLFREDRTSDLPCTIFLYALAFLGRFARALAGVISRDALFSFLSKNARISHECDTAEQSDTGFFEIRAEFGIDGANKETLCFIDSLTAKVKDMWIGVRSGHGLEVSATLRSMRKEIALISMGSHECHAEVSFAARYLKLVELLSRAWGLFLSFPPTTPADEDASLISAQLKQTLNELTYRFSGLTAPQQLCILELTCLSYILTPSVPEITPVRSLISRVQTLCRERSLIPSGFLLELEKLLGESVFFEYESCKEIIRFFDPERVVLSGGNLEIAWAEVDVLKWDPLRPMRFVPGMPVGIEMVVRLNNVREESRVWIVMDVGVSSEAVFLEPDRTDRALVVPFYRTPKTAFFAMKIFVAAEFECLDETHRIYRVGGPRLPIVRLCSDKEIFFSIQ